MDEKEIYQKSVDKWGEEKQKIIAIEELSELTKEITKDLRNKASKENLAEEIADVELMIEQLKFIYQNKKEVLEHKAFKVKRLMERLEK